MAAAASFDSPRPSVQTRGRGLSVEEHPCAQRGAIGGQTPDSAYTSPPPKERGEVLRAVWGGAGEPGAPMRGVQAKRRRCRSRDESPVSPRAADLSSLFDLCSLDGAAGSDDEVLLELATPLRRRLAAPALAFGGTPARPARGTRRPRASEHLAGLRSDNKEN